MVSYWVLGLSVVFAVFVTLVARDITERPKLARYAFLAFWYAWDASRLRAGVEYRDRVARETEYIDFCGMHGIERAPHGMSKSESLQPPPE